MKRADEGIKEKSRSWLREVRASGTRYGAVVGEQKSVKRESGRGRIASARRLYKSLTEIKLSGRWYEARDSYDCQICRGHVD